MSKTWQGVFLIVSTIVGLGVFLLPFALAQSGFYFWLWFFFLIFLIYLLHLAYGEIIFQIRQKHNLPGLAAELLGPQFKLPVWFFDFGGFQLIFLAYLVALSKFIPLIYALPPLPVKLLTASLVALVSYFSLNPLAKIESGLSLILIALFLVLSFSLLPAVDWQNIATAFQLPFNSTNQPQPFISYGLLIFALSGYAILPVVYDLLGRSGALFRKVNLSALIIIFLLYALFALSVYGAVGLSVSEEALSSLPKILPRSLVIVSVILASVNIFTTFIALAFYLKRGLRADFNFKPPWAWLAVTLPILIFVFLPLENLSSLAAKIGSLFLGFNLIIILTCYLRLKTVTYFKIPKIIIWLALVVLGVGWFTGLILE